MFCVPRSTSEGLKEERIRILISSVKSPTDIGEDTPLIDDIGTVSSYNWLAEDEVDSDVPTIQVPGAPPVVSFPKDAPSMKLEPDAGHHFIDQNACRMKGTSGMIPGLAACHAYKKDFKVTDYDVITDRNNLIKLFELIELAEDKNRGRPTVSTPWRAPSIQSAAARRGRGGHHIVHPFFQNQAIPGLSHGRGIESMNRRAETTRVDVDIVSGYNNDTGKYIYDDTSATKTLVLTRWEPKNEEDVFSSIDFRGFGHSFLTKTRKFLSFEDGGIRERGPKDVTGFHCLVEYKLYGMKTLVRYHADACDMTRAEFIKWISEDAIRGLSESDNDSDNDNKDGNQDGNGDGSEDGSEDRTLLGSPETDTFDLLDAFKTLSVKTDETNTMNNKLVSNIKKSTAEASSPFKLSSLPEVPIDIIHTPNTVFPGEKILQVKTRGQHTGLNREKLCAQLFFSQTQKVYVAYHSRGLFSEIDASKEDITTELSKWGDDNKERLKKLISILREVKEKVSELGGKAALGFVLKKKNSEDPVVLDIQPRDD